MGAVAPSLFGDTGLRCNYSPAPPPATEGVMVRTRALLYSRAWQSPHRRPLAAMGPLTPQAREGVLSPCGASLDLSPRRAAPVWALPVSAPVWALVWALPVSVSAPVW